MIILWEELTRLRRNPRHRRRSRAGHIQSLGGHATSAYGWLRARRGGPNAESYNPMIGIPSVEPLTR